MAGDLTISTINGGAIGAKNALINGNFGINQRAVSGTVTLSAGAYGHDRFKAGASGCTYTFATSNNITTLTITAGSLIQVIEGINLQSGTYTLSWTGTAQGKIGGGSYAGSGVTETVTGGTNLNIEFDTGTLSLVQLEAGSVATPFEHRQYGQELALCQRYCQVYTGIVNQRVGLSGNGGNTSFPTLILKTIMRSTPTLTVSSASHFSSEGLNGGRTATSSLSANILSPDSVTFEAVTTGITGSGTNLLINSTSGKITLDSEL